MCRRSGSKAWFRLEAKYLYLGDRVETVRLGLERAARSRAKLGACIEFTVVPVGTAALPLTRWQGRQVELDAREQTSPSTTSHVFDRKRTFGDDLRCSFGGLPTTWRYEIAWQRGALWFERNDEAQLRPGTTERIDIQPGRKRSPRHLAR